MSEKLPDNSDDIAGRPMKRVFRNTLLLLGSQAFSNCTMLAKGIIIVRAISADEYGTLVLAIAYVLTVEKLMDCKTWETISKYIPDFIERNDKRRATATLQLCCGIELVTGLLGMLAVWCTGEWAAELFVRTPGGAELIWLASLLLALRIPNEAISALLRVADRYDLIVGQRAIASVFELSAVAIVCWISPNVKSLLCTQLICAAVAALVFLVLGVRVASHLGLRLRPSFSIAPLHDRRREFVQFVILANITSSGKIVKHCATLLLGLICPPAAVAAYHLAKRLVGIGTSLSATMNHTTFPEIAKLAAAQQIHALHKLQWRLTLIILSVVLPACVLATILAPWIISVLVGGEYAQAILPLQILVWSWLSISLFWFRPYLLVSGRAKTAAAFSCINKTIYILSFVILTHAYGIVGAATAVSFHAIVRIVLATVVLRFINKGVTVPQEHRLGHAV